MTQIIATFNFCPGNCSQFEPFSLTVGSEDGSLAGSHSRDECLKRTLNIHLGILLMGIGHLQASWGRLGSHQQWFDCMSETKTQSIEIPDHINYYTTSKKRNPFYSAYLSCFFF